MIIGFRPKVKLTGKDGNAFNILGICANALRKSGFSKEYIDGFTSEATSGDYNHLLAIAGEYCDVS